MNLARIKAAALAAKNAKNTKEATMQATVAQPTTQPTAPKAAPQASSLAAAIARAKAAKAEQGTQAVVAKSIAPATQLTAKPATPTMPATTVPQRAAPATQPTKGGSLAEIMARAKAARAAQIAAKDALRNPQAQPQTSSRLLASMKKAGMTVDPLLAKQASAVVAQAAAPTSEDRLTHATPTAPTPSSAVAATTAPTTTSTTPTAPAPESAADTSEVEHRLDKNSVTLEDLNAEQRRAVELSLDGGNVLVTGSAGTGKSTTQRVTLSELARAGHLKPLPDTWEHRYIPKGGYSIAVVSFITRAVNNIRDLLPMEFKPNACNIHQFLEFAPEIEVVEEINEEGELVERERKIFKPRRHADNLIEGLTCIVVEESSTVDTQLFDLLLDALPNRGEGIQFIFLGDICQIKPVFGQSIIAKFGPKWLEQGRVVGLNEVYRTAGTSPILKLAIDINEGKSLWDSVLRDEYCKDGELDIVNLSGIASNGKPIPRRPPHVIAPAVANFYIRELQLGRFEPFEDIILVPFRKAKPTPWVCTEYFNGKMADAHGKMRGAVVHEVIAGFNNHYLAVGDPIVLEKDEYYIEGIVDNPRYRGARIPKSPSELLGRDGRYEGQASDAVDLNSFADMEISIQQQVQAALNSTPEEVEATSREASHILTLRDIRTGAISEVRASGEINKIDFAYACTVHRSIGSEFRRVYLCMHHSHLSMLTREIVYTAITRAKEYLHIFTEGKNHATNDPTASLMVRAATTPWIQGITLEEKLLWLAKQDAKANEDTTNLLDKYKKKSKD